MCASWDMFDPPNKVLIAWNRMGGPRAWKEMQHRQMEFRQGFNEEPLQANSQEEEEEEDEEGDGHKMRDIYADCDIETETENEIEARGGNDISDNDGDGDVSGLHLEMITSNITYGLLAGVYDVDDAKDTQH